MSEKKQTQTERLHDVLAAKLGSNWRKDILTYTRADTLYWIVHLAEAGIAARLAEFRSLPGGLDGSAIASISTWRDDLEKFVTHIEHSESLRPAATPKSRKKS